MDAFEEIVASMLRKQGFWAQSGYKVEISKADKVALGKPSLPQPEIDIIAYSPKDNLLKWVECKSYLDSRGVTYSGLSGKDKRTATRYRAFTDSNYRKIVSKVLVKQLVTEGLTLPRPKVRYCLVAGRIATESDREKLHQHFKTNGWILYDERWLASRLDELSEIGYEDDVAVIVATLARRIQEIK